MRAISMWVARQYLSPKNTWYVEDQATGKIVVSGGSRGLCAEDAQLIAGAPTLAAERDKLKSQRDALLAAAKAAYYVVTGGYIGLKSRKQADSELQAKLRAAIEEAEKP